MLQTLFYRIQSLDWWMMLSIFVLLILGTSAIYSVALSQTGSSFLVVKKHLIAMGVGLSGAALLAGYNYRLWRNYSVVLYAGSLVLLVLVLFFGQTIRGTTGWFDFGVFNFQPVELAKFGLACALAAYFSRNARSQFGWREFIQSGVITALPVLLVLMQPDFGSATLLVGMWVITVVAAGLSFKKALVLAGASVCLLIIGWFFLFADYQKDRIMTFLDPSIDPLGQGYNVTQAIIAVGAGQWFGRGLGFGSQSQLKFLPESQTDFLFAVIAEEFGFVGVVLLLGAFLLFFLRVLMHVRLRVQDAFFGGLFIALSGVLFMQFFINTAMNLGLFPVTGVGLPFVSYGGSALLFAFAALGVMQNMVWQSRRS